MDGDLQVSEVYMDIHPSIPNAFVHASQISSVYMHIYPLYCMSKYIVTHLCVTIQMFFFKYYQPLSRIKAKAKNFK